MYYVYEVWDSDKNIPIYVGYGKYRKGKSRPRYKDHCMEALAFNANKIKNVKKLNMLKINVLSKILDSGKEPEYKIAIEHVTLEEAYDRETELITLYGRRDLGTGPLTNLDSGGRSGCKKSNNTRKKISNSLKGRESPTKGMIFGKYSDERIQSARLGHTSWLSAPESHDILSNAQSGKVLSDEHKTKISLSLKGRPSPMKGRSGYVSWNKGLTKDNNDKMRKLSESCKGRPSPTKGKTMSTKGKTYEEIYGIEKAKEMRDVRSSTCWINNKIENKKIKKADINQWISDGWIKGRIMPPNCINYKISSSTL